MRWPWQKKKVVTPPPPKSKPKKSSDSPPPIIDPPKPIIVPVVKPVPPPKLLKVVPTTVPVIDSPPIIPQQLPPPVTVPVVVKKTPPPVPPKPAVTYITLQTVDGDCCSSLASTNNLSDYKDLYNIQSDLFKSKYPNPNQLEIGATYKVPVKGTGQVGRPTTAQHSFVVKTSKTNLRIILIDRENKAFTPQSLTITIKGNPTILGASGMPNGLAELKDIPLDAPNGSVLATRLKPTAYVHPVAVTVRPTYTAGTKMKYPPEIQPGQFQDVEKEDYTGKYDTTINWALSLGCLATYKISGGVQARLNNLGFATTPDITVGVKGYQRFQNKIKKQTNPVTGVWTDIQADIKTVHDNP